MKKNFNSRSFNAYSFIEPRQVTRVVDMHLRNAQTLLKDLRQELGLSKNAGITVDEFCKKMNFEVDEILKTLNYISF